MRTTRCPGELMQRRLLLLESQTACAVCYSITTATRLICRARSPQWGCARACVLNLNACAQCCVRVLNVRAYAVAPS